MPHRRIGQQRTVPLSSMAFPELGGSAVVAAPDANSAFLTAEETSSYLWQRFRLRRSPRRLAQLRALPAGAGPPFYRDGCVVRYRSASVDTWALQQLGNEFTNTTAESAYHQQHSAAVCAPITRSPASPRVQQPATLFDPAPT
jgi:hypothetical protein